MNKRYVKDRILSGGAEKAFKGMIPIGKFGFLILDIEMDPSKVDVNVHPAKLEVRFEEEQKVFKAVYCGIQDTLLKAELIANSGSQLAIKNESIEGGKMGEEQETNSGLAGLFRKIAKNADEGENLIESIYNSKNGENENQVESKDLQENLDVPEKVKEDNFSENFQTNSNETIIDPINKEEAIKNTINEFMQMGKNLTAEQIREKISKIAQASRQSETNQLQDESKIESVNTVDEIEKSSYEEEIPEWRRMLNQKIAEKKGNNDYQSNYTEASNEPVKKDLFDETFSNFTLVPPKTENILNNMALENNEDYETKIINTEEIQQAAQNIEIPNEERTNSNESQIDIEGQKPGDILLNILREQSKSNVTPTIPAGQFNDMYAQIFGNKAKPSVDEQKEEINANDIVNSNINLFEEDEEAKSKLPYRFIGIAFRTYIILEIKDELYILDQHAAHERIMYEKVKQNYYSDEDKDSQLMLLPDVITLTHKEMDIARENMDKFEKAGFVLEEFGENTIKLTGVPNICLDLDTKELFLETLDEINTVARTAKQEIEERFIATIACKAAVKANMVLTQEEVESLLDELLKLPNPFTCPHGRPTAIKLSKMDIEKKFARRK